jgi:hypothetical protein
MVPSTNLTNLPLMTPVNAMSPCVVKRRRTQVNTWVPSFESEFSVVMVVCLYNATGDGLFEMAQNESSIENETTFETPSRRNGGHTSERLRYRSAFSQQQGPQEVSRKGIARGVDSLGAFPPCS